MISMVFLYLGWKAVTEDYWDEVTTERMSEYGGDRYSSVGNPLLQGNQGSLRSDPGLQDNALTSRASHYDHVEQEAGNSKI